MHPQDARLEADLANQAVRLDCYALAVAVAVAVRVVWVEIHMEGFLATVHGQAVLAVLVGEVAVGVILPAGDIVQLVVAQLELLVGGVVAHPLA
jgi:hypothetical protein